MTNAQPVITTMAGQSGYYVLRKGSAPTKIEVPVRLWTELDQQVFVDETATNQARFYRVERVSKLVPDDADGDGIDDCYELFYRHPNAVLNGSDGNEDHNVNGVPDSLDYTRLSLANGGVRSRSLLALGNYSTVCLKKDGTAWGFGDNTSNQLDRADIPDAAFPTQVGCSANWRSIRESDCGSFGLRSDGTAWAWGGRIGETQFLRQIGTNADWVALIPGPTYLWLLRKDGSAWAAGVPFTNEPSQLTFGVDWSALAVTNVRRYGIKQDGSLWLLSSPPVQVGSDSDWRAIAIGGESVMSVQMAIKTNGTLWSWGYNVYGQLGLGAAAATTNVPQQVGTESNWISVAIAPRFVIALKADGSVWGWGDNRDGCIGSATDEFTFAPVQLVALSNIIAIAAARDHCAAVDDCGRLWTFGRNRCGDMGDGIQSIVRRPTQVGASSDWAAIAAGFGHSVAIRKNGSLWGWGDNFFGQLGISTNARVSVPSRIGAAQNWQSVHPGYQFTVAVKTDGTMWSWGKNNRGQLGLGTLTHTNLPQQVGTNSDWAAASAGYIHTLAKKTDGTLWAWGEGVFGALANPGVWLSTTPIRADMTVGCGSGSRFGVFSAGHNSSIAATRYTTAYSGCLSEWGWPVDIPGAAYQVPIVVAYGRFAAVCTSEYHAERNSFALALADGKLYAWGFGTSGQFGTNLSALLAIPWVIGTNDNWTMVEIGDRHAVGLQSDGTMWSWGDTMLDLPEFPARSITYTATRVGSEADWTAIAAGTYHCLALKRDGTLWAWGENSYGECGQTVSQPVVRVSGSDWGVAMH